MVSGAHLPEGWAPGRVFAVPGSSALWELAQAIDISFGRWDFSHEREFTVKGKDLNAGPFERGADRLTLDSLDLVVEEVFTYVFDLGDVWEHTCLVRNAAADLPGQWDSWKPAMPTPVFGWGSMPDQYGRESMSDDGSVEE